ncbi:MAG: tetratricopeptide repeat protein [Acidobacteria bacterium]|nr:tetratricopeptide repeat protein [Acidobacteriota bacterium]
MRFGTWMCIPLIVCPLLAGSQERGRELVQSRDFKTAETEMQKAVDENGDDACARLYLGIAQTHLGRGATAVDTLKKAVDLDGNSAGARYALAMAQIEAKQFSDAESTLREAEGLDGGHADRQSVKGSWFAAQKRFKESVEPLEAAVESRPTDAYAHYYLGLAYSNLKRPDKMIKHFEEFLRLEPDSPNASRVRAFLKNVR